MSTDPKNIVSLLPSATEIVCALGLEERLVGVTHECDFPEDIGSRPHVTSSHISHVAMTSKEIDHEVRSQLDGHGSIYGLDEDLLRSLDPDLILTQELCDVCAVNYETVAAAAKIHAADAAIVSLEPTTIGEILENIETVGNVCGVPERARNLTSVLKRRIEAIRKQSSGTQTRPRVMMLEWLEPPFAPGHWVPEQVEIAGGECLLGESGMKSVTTTFEEICESNPEIVVLIPCGYYIDDILGQLDQTVFPEILRDIDAFKTGNLWAVDAAAYFSRPGPRVVDGAEILAKVLHPEIFGEPNGSEARSLDASSFVVGASGSA
ncbi:MAG: cobalamin-binding protein [Acidobacteriota bacterium]|nr:cobalamin-binding protein [Acidobacteriota bacterium]MDH3528296.1 cobalamin-binding protein [Acidobacteriota bacterium]